MKMRSMAAVLLFASLVSGCGQFGRMARVNPANVSARPQQDQNCPLTNTLDGDDEFAIDLGCFKFDGKNAAANAKTAYQEATDSAANAANAAKLARNRLEAVLLTHADTICKDELGEMYANRAMSNGILDLLSSSFSTTSTIVGGQQAKSILSGLAGLSTATRNNIDANVYQNQLVSAITKVITAEKTQILSLMRSKRGASIADYSADEMIFMANQYHQACSFEKGVELLLDAAVNKEGADRIIQGMNLATARKNLEDAISSANKSGVSAEQLAIMREALAQTSLQQLENSKASDSVVVPEIADE